MGSLAYYILAVSRGVRYSVHLDFGAAGDASHLMAETRFIECTIGLLVIWYPPLDSKRLRNGLA